MNTEPWTKETVREICRGAHGIEEEWQRVATAHNATIGALMECPVNPDTKRLDTLERAYEIRRSKRGWAVLMQFTNYEYDLYPTLRQAIDDAMREEKP